MAHPLKKPSHVFDRDREWKALADFAADGRPEATLGSSAGGGARGRPTCFGHSPPATGGCFFEAAEATEADSLRMFGAALARQGGSAAGFSFPGWEDALRYFLPWRVKDRCR